MAHPQMGSSLPHRNDQSANDTAVLIHLSAFASFLFPFGNILVPFLLWHFKKDDHPRVDAAGRTVLNFQISFTIYIALIIMGIFVAILGSVGLAVGSTEKFVKLLLAGDLLLVAALFVILLIFAIFDIVMIVVGALSVSGGKDFRYPFCIRFL